MQTTLTNPQAAHQGPDAAPSLESPSRAVKPPMNPDTQAEWARRFEAWEKVSPELTKIQASPQELIRAQELLEALVSGAPRAAFWRSVEPEDYKVGLLAALAQYKAYSPLSKAPEPNKKTLPPFEVCVKMLGSDSSPEVKDLTYLLLQKAEYALTPDQRKELQVHFDQTALATPLKSLARETAERLNFKLAANSDLPTTAA